MRNEDFADQVALVDRLVTTRKEVVFLVGAPLSTPTIPGVQETVELVKSEIPDGPAHERLTKVLAASKNAYQDAFDVLIKFRGQDGANAVIRKAVVRARSDGGSAVVAAALVPNATVRDFEAIEADLAAWKLTPGVEHLGRLVTARPDVFGRRILTTNFDPLIEVSVAVAGGQFCKIFLHSDGALGQISTNACQVVHLHGDWCRSDTLHTPTQLLQPRPALAASLRRILEGCTLVVLAYGGWDDIFTQALASVVHDNGANFDVLWTFHSRDPEAIRGQYAPLVAQLSPGVARGRVVPYLGIDAHVFLPELWKAIAPHSTPLSLPTAAILEDALANYVSPPSSLPPQPSGNMSPQRELATRFLSLPFVLRTKIVEELGLVEAGENPATDPMFFGRCFTRAKAKGILDQLWARVALHHPGQMQSNPFTRES